MYDPTKSLSKQIVGAFAKACGGKLMRPDEYEGGPVALYGVQPLTKPIWQEIKKWNQEFYFIDNGYFSDRSKHYTQRYYRIVKNALHYQGPNNPDRGRWKQLSLQVRPWRDGDHILVCPPGDFWMTNMHSTLADRWLDDTVGKIKRHTKREIRIRPKPKKIPFKPLEEDLKEAHALVTFMSASAYWGLLHGVPCFVDFEHGAHKLGNSLLANIESPRKPEGREEWFATLAGQQWRIDEFDLAWKTLNG